MYNALCTKIAAFHSNKRNGLGLSILGIIIVAVIVSQIPSGVNPPNTASACAIFNEPTVVKVPLQIKSWVLPPIDRGGRIISNPLQYLEILSGNTITANMYIDNILLPRLNANQDALRARMEVISQIGPVRQPCIDYLGLWSDYEDKKTIGFNQITSSRDYFSSRNCQYNPSKPFDAIENQFPNFYGRGVPSTLLKNYPRIFWAHFDDVQL